MIKRNITEDNKFYVSPLEVRHFILDIPITKNKYRYKAVRACRRACTKNSIITKGNFRINAGKSSLCKP